MSLLPHIIAQATSGGSSGGSSQQTAKAIKAIALGVGAGLGTIGPGVGVGYIFGKVIESVTSIQWLGFALTEAIIFYAFIFGLIAYFLSGG